MATKANMNNKLLNFSWIRTPYFLLRNLKIFYLDFGFVKTIYKWSSETAHGEPIPWFTYPAIEYLRQFDFSSKSIFEYGSGNSTLYWEKHAKRLVSVESDPYWFQKVKPKLMEKTTYLLCEEKEEYIQAIGNFSGELFDVIVIDGIHRMECAQTACKFLADGGMHILDNSDWYPNITAFLRGQDLIEVDMTGFGPSNYYTSTTSFFLHRLFRFQPAYDREPVSGVGSIPAHYDQETL